MFMHEQVSFNTQEQKLVSRCPVYDHIPNTSKYLTRETLCFKQKIFLHLSFNKFVIQRYAHISQYGLYCQLLTLIDNIFSNSTSLEEIESNASSTF